MQSYDPAVGLGCVLAPSVQEYTPLIMATQAQFEQTLQAQSRDETRK